MSTDNKNGMQNQLENYKESTGREAIFIQGRRDSKPSMVEKRVQIIEEFAFIFFGNLKKVLSENKLSTTDLVVLFAILERWNIKSPLGLINISQSGIAKELGMKRQQVSRSYQRLEVSGILVRDGKDDLGVNPSLFLRGSPKDLINQRMDLLERGMAAIGVTKRVV